MLYQDDDKGPTLVARVNSEEKLDLPCYAIYLFIIFIVVVQPSGSTGGSVVPG